LSQFADVDIVTGVVFMLLMLLLLPLLLR
jgi:hypothetical protein